MNNAEGSYPAGVSECHCSFRRIERKTERGGELDVPRTQTDGAAADRNIDDLPVIDPRGDAIDCGAEEDGIPAAVFKSSILHADRTVFAERRLVPALPIEVGLPVAGFGGLRRVDLLRGMLFG
jgi:hypothetical protein